MSKFVALPVCGDAFLVEHRPIEFPPHSPKRHDCVNILVDSGGSGVGLAEALTHEAPDLEYIHVAVCTHADCDHAGGFTTLLKHWPHRNKNMSKENGDKEAPIGEFWLPWVWYGVIRGMMKDPDDFMGNIVREIKSISDSISERMKSHEGSNPDTNLKEEVNSVRDAADAEMEMDKKILSGEEHLEAETYMHTHESVNAETKMKKLHEELILMRKLRKNIIRNRDTIAKCTEMNEFMQNEILERCSRECSNKFIEEYWRELIEAAGNIGKIVLSALDHDIDIRWFDYEKFKDTGKPYVRHPEYLVPINSVERIQPPSKNVKTVCFLHLSVNNRQCLAFHSPGGFFIPEILFCGDSPMGYGTNFSKSFELPELASQSKPTSVIVTAPHHGSKSNKMAYDHICNEILSHAASDKLLWVRSGGTPDHPGNWYREIPSKHRICTWCPDKYLQKQSVKICLSEFSGNPSNALLGYQCDCQPK